MKCGSSFAFLIVSSLVVCLGNRASASSEDKTFDVVIYGGTSAGIAAAVQVKRMGGTVVVIEPTSRIGGLTTGGLGQTDIGNKAAIGGVSREFYQRIRKHYEADASWRWQRPDEYRSGGQSRSRSQEDTMWTFEPSVALRVMQDLVDENEIEVVYRQRLNRAGPGVVKNEARILSIQMEGGRTFRGRTFIDATYEGDLLAEAGVSWTVGREANAEYGETLSGVQTRRAIHHQFVRGVDPYVTAGDSSSGLLPGVDAAGPGVEGMKDHRVQAYCFRMCLTDHPDNRLPFTKPADYHEVDYELLFRNFEAGAKNIPWSNSAMPNRKTDVNNNKGFSTDFIGRNYNYPDASYKERDRIVAEHLRYQQGLMWTLANHARVPEWVRKEISRWGTCKDEFERADGWQQQLYIREARRMIGNYVMTQHNCQGREVASTPVGLAAYTMDSHNVQRHVGDDGFVLNEGDVQVGGFSPYPIEFGALVPKRSECTNLLVPVCLSATHMAFGSIRMEPVFMVLGQSAATAAMHSLRQNVDVQDVDDNVLRTRLEADAQVLRWTGPQRTSAVGIDPESLPGIVIDDEAAERIGFDSSSTSAGPFIGIGYRHDGNDGKGRQSAVFRVTIKKAGKYVVRLAYSPFSNRSTNVPVVVTHAGGTTKFVVNEQAKPQDAPFVSVAELLLAAGEVSITVSNDGTNGYVIIDAVQLLPQD
ncbi:MAG: FAD-dependent oxidoreductase [Fuerstiella sp.]